MLHGKKKWTLIDPEYSPLLAPTRPSKEHIYFIQGHVLVFNISKIFKQNFKKQDEKTYKQMSDTYDFILNLPKFTEYADFAAYRSHPRTWRRSYQSSYVVSLRLKMSLKLLSLWRVKVDLFVFH